MTDNSGDIDALRKKVEQAYWTLAGLRGRAGRSSPGSLGPAGRAGGMPEAPDGLRHGRLRAPSSARRRVAPWRLRSARAAGHGGPSRPGSVLRAASTSRRLPWCRPQIRESSRRLTRAAWSEGQSRRRWRRRRQRRRPQCRSRPRRRSSQPASPGTERLVPVPADLRRQPGRPGARLRPCPAHDHRAIGPARSSEQHFSSPSGRSSRYVTFSTAARLGEPAIRARRRRMRFRPTPRRPASERWPTSSTIRSWRSLACSTARPRSTPPTERSSSSHRSGEPSSATPASRARPWLAARCAGHAVRASDADRTDRAESVHRRQPVTRPSPCPRTEPRPGDVAVRFA